MGKGNKSRSVISIVPQRKIFLCMASLYVNPPCLHSLLPPTHRETNRQRHKKIHTKSVLLYQDNMY